MSKQAEAELILKLYDLRREEKMRKARDWYFMEFNPKTIADFQAVLFGEHGASARMVMSYWDMAAALVKHGAISVDMFTDTNGEYYGVYSKIEHLLPEIRQMFGPQFFASLDKLIDDTPGGRQRVAEMKQRMKMIQETLAAQQQKTQAAKH